ncbi:hypothetical protein [Hyalangium gracile]|uniref:hypothetical protein n=1 Tax=Hyalangium gracile TaxID=394092 RepID=UPI001CC9F51F|nr:hypothetical protein [Hyalangium gracile]
MAVRREWTIGSHRAHFEEPDLLVMKYNGKFNLEEARLVVELYREVGTQRPFFLLADITGAEIASDARKHLTDQIKPEWFRGIVYAGASPVMRAVGKAMAVTFYFTGKWSTPFEFTATAEEARALIARLREKQQANPT